MKHTIASCLLFLLCILRAVSQDTTAAFRISEIPATGLTLNKGWTYLPGDNILRAQPGHVEGGWIAIDPTDELHHLAQVRDNQIGWFRLRLIVDSQWRNKSVAFIASGLGASEVYMNGKLVHRFGTVSADYDKEDTRYYTNQLLSLTFNDQPEQVLTVRHSLNKKNLYLKFTYPRPVAKFVLKVIDQAFADHVRDDNFDATLRSIQVSFYLPLGFLLIFIFYWFRLQKEYLYAGIFCFCMFSAILLHIFALSEPVTVNRSNQFLYATQVLYIVGAISFINGTYILYNRKKSWFFWVICAYGIVSLILYFISYDWSGLFNAFFFPIINFEFLRLNYYAVRRRRKGSVILFITSLLLNLSLLLYIWFTIMGQGKASLYLQSVSFIIPGIGLSLFFAGEFARTASSLRLRATELEVLSEEMVAAEREKQQILEAQNETLERQVSERTAELRQSLQELKDAEAQLIQREKMASLGELTAGIAHEIQNPLNFVNNFADVSNELIDEMTTALDEGEIGQAKSLALEVRQNLEKIHNHGNRADGIVKGMLQHSRLSAGQKEPTDINVLVDEYMRLAYHGLRAKDKSFNAKFETQLDNTIPKINIVAQDIGRVILNLINNAFYAVTEKRNSGIRDFEPTVKVQTQKSGDNVEIKVQDNGNGIPNKVIEKIFQPFFTTKPAGQGTGLGLSLSYDIITKGHGGDLKVKTMEREGSEFVISLPMNGKA